LEVHRSGDLDPSEIEGLGWGQVHELDELVVLVGMRGVRWGDGVEVEF
jgi:hypothetical protein